MKRERKLKVIVPEVVDGGTYSDLVNAIGGLQERARSKIAAVANFELVKTYWETGRYIVEYERESGLRAVTSMLRSWLKSAYLGTENKS